MTVMPALETPVRRRLKPVLAVLRVALGVGLLAYVAHSSGAASLSRQLVREFWVWPALVGLSVVGTAIEAKRLGILLRSQGVHLPFGNACRVVAVGTFFNFCIPGGTGGDVMKLYYLGTANRTRVVEVATVLLVDRALALLSLLSVVLGLALLGGPLVAHNTTIRWLVTAAAAVVALLLSAGLLACSVRVRRSRWYRAILAVLPLRHHVQRVSDALAAFGNHKRSLLSAVALSMLGHFVLAGMFVALGAVLIPNAKGITTGLLALLGMVANALPVTPGGLGIGEVAFASLFEAAGFSGGAALILAWRAGMLPLCLAGGLVYMSGAEARRGSVEPAREVIVSTERSPSPAAGGSGLT